MSYAHTGFIYLFEPIMAKTGSKKNRINSLTTRKLNEKISDVTLSDFADSVNPGGKGRLRKSKNVFSLVQKISTSDDIDAAPVEDNEEEFGSAKVDQLSETVNVMIKKNEENNNQYTEYPLKIWLLLAEYITPEDVMSFSLICRNALMVVNTPLFWIRLYKRYYRKTDIPKCLSCGCLEIRKCLKQKVVRSLHYFYSPYASSVMNNNMLSTENLVGTLCLLHWVQGFKEKDSNDGLRWLYTFKLCHQDLNENLMNNSSCYHNFNDIHYNPDIKCRMLKVICKDFVVIPSVRGMRLRKLDTNTKTTTLKFSSAPLSKVNSELGTVTFHLDHTQKPLILPWWHPDYWEHTKCCNKRNLKLSFSC